MDFSPKRSLTRLLKVAAMPIGRVLYVWGGGWNEQDNGAGFDAVHCGLSPAWLRFYEENATLSYDYRQHRYRIHDGLDCSGYLGWVVYNTLWDEDGREGFVFSSTCFAESLAARGLGLVVHGEDAGRVAGDIVSINGHVYLSLGAFSDSTLLFLHASPPCLSVCGTELGENCMASLFAADLMKRCYPACASVFPPYGRAHEAYTENMTVFRFYDEMVPDPDHIRKKTPQEIAKMLFL